MNYISYEQVKELLKVMKSDIDSELQKVKEMIQNGSTSGGEEIANDKYKYFRIVFEHSARGEVLDKMTGDNYYGIAIAELYLYNDEDILISEAPYASDWQADTVYNNRADFGVAKAFDGDPTTEWGSNNTATPSHWLMVSCEQPQRLAKIGITPRVKVETDGKPITISVQASNGVTWVTLKTFDNLWNGWESQVVRYFEL